jgi:hypothetical protein
VQERVLDAALDVEVQVLLERDDLMRVRERRGIRADRDEARSLVDEVGATAIAISHTKAGRRRPPDSARNRDDAVGAETAMRTASRPRESVPMGTPCRRARGRHESWR